MFHPLPVKGATAKYSVSSALMTFEQGGIYRAKPTVTRGPGFTGHKEKDLVTKKYTLFI
jgi:hypothetical protein